MRTILPEDAGPVVEQDEVERLIARYFEQVYAIQQSSEDRAAEFLDELMEQVEEDI